MSTRSCFLVDDDEDDREIFYVALQKAKADFVCAMAKDGKEAIHLTKKNDFVPAYIFVDLNMPLVTGRECVEAFKKIDRLHSVPIIVYSTSSAQKDIEDIQNLGARHYLVKPPKFTELVATLEQLFTGKDLPFLLNG